MSFIGCCVHCVRINEACADPCKASCPNFDHINDRLPEAIKAFEDEFEGHPTVHCLTCEVTEGVCSVITSGTCPRITGPRDSNELHVTPRNIGPCVATYTVELPGDGSPCWKRWLTVKDTDGNEVIKFDYTSDMVGHQMVLSRLYDALNAGADDHACSILTAYLETLDPFGDIKRPSINDDEIPF